MTKKQERKLDLLARGVVLLLLRAEGWEVKTEAGKVRRELQALFEDERPNGG